MASNRRELEQMMRQLGFSLLRRTGSGHLCWQHPCGVRYTTPSTPSDCRGLRNARSEIRRALQRQALN